MEEKVRWQGHTCRVLKNVKKEGEFRSLKKIVRALELVGVLRIGNGSLPPLLHFLRDWLSPDALSAFSTVSICNKHLLFVFF